MYAESANVHMFVRGSDYESPAIGLHRPADSYEIGLGRPKPKRLCLLLQQCRPRLSAANGSNEQSSHDIEVKISQKK